MSERVDKLANEIRTLMRGAQEWDRKRTSIPGVFVVRMPGEALRIMLMFSPTDEAGNPRKRKGLYFADSETVEAARRAFPDERLDALVAAAQLINGPSTRKAAGDRDLLEV